MPTEVDERPRVYLNSVHLKGFKSIEDLTIDFQKGLNILIGKNGSGKSNFMEFLISLFEAKLDRLFPFRFAEFKILSEDNHLFTFLLEKKHIEKSKERLFSETTAFLEKLYIDDELKYNSDEDSHRKRIEFKNRKMPYFGPTTSFSQFGYRPFYPIYLKYDLPTNIECLLIPGRIVIEIEDAVPDWTYPTAFNSIKTAIWDLELYYDSIDVKNLIDISAQDIVDKLHLREPIIENLRRFSPIEDVEFSKNISLYNTEERIVIENVKLDFKINGVWLPWSQLSDGTRRLFYLIAELTEATGLGLIEEPELGIHPHQFHLLMNFLKEQSEDKQIILSTHSPKALDHLNENELGNILIAEYDLRKGTQIRHLTDEETDKAKEYIKEVGFLSDYWLMSDLEQW